MRRPVTLMGLVLVAVVTALALAAVALSAAGGTDRPFTGSAVGSADFLPDPSCPLGFRSVADVSGTASHLGLVRFSSNHCFALPNLLTQGQGTLVAANGDELYVTYAGSCNPPDFATCVTDTVVVGGTGRFANATGEFQVTAVITNTVPPRPLAMTWEGTLSY
ncbi:MAG TPA: hypothetical protein VLD13_08000 [Gaiellaceae bacterium]|nr:hypothetical protein [Gaiellaceae bacterium]